MVPVGFLWVEGIIWISSYRSTRKVIDISSNNRCALVVDIVNPGDGLTAVVIEGMAELVSTPIDWVKQRIKLIYIKYLGLEGLEKNDPQTWLNSSENVLIKLTPKKVKAW